MNESALILHSLKIKFSEEITQIKKYNFNLSINLELNSN